LHIFSKLDNNIHYLPALKHLSRPSHLVVVFQSKLSSALFHATNTESKDHLALVVSIK